MNTRDIERVLKARSKAIDWIYDNQMDLGDWDDGTGKDFANLVSGFLPKKKSKKKIAKTNQNENRSNRFPIESPEMPIEEDYIRRID